MSPLGTFSVFHVTSGIKTTTLQNQGRLSSSCQYSPDFPSVLHPQPLQRSSNPCPPLLLWQRLTCRYQKIPTNLLFETSHPPNRWPKNSIHLFSLSWFLWIQHSASACSGGSGSKSQVFPALGPTQRLLSSHIWPTGWEDLQGWGRACWVSVVPLRGFSSMEVSLLQGNEFTSRERARQMLCPF